jgi:hypothetical protein
LLKHTIRPWWSNWGTRASACRPLDRPDSGLERVAGNGYAGTSPARLWLFLAYRSVPPARWFTP